MYDVDIFSIDLAVVHPKAARLVSSAELARASRFFFERDRRRFLNCRAALREILSVYTGRAPERIEFRVNSFGKPSTSHVFFNLSHSHDFAMIAVSRTREVGIDVEKIDEKFMRDNIPQRFFPPNEVRKLQAMPFPTRTQAFFNCWTRKEAYVKARGLGLSLALSSFEVTLAPGEPARFLRGAGGWSIESIETKPGYAAAIVAEGLDSEASDARDFVKSAEAKLQRDSGWRSQTPIQPHTRNSAGSIAPM